MGDKVNIFNFMAESPFLTFFLVLIVGETLCVLFKALGGKYKCRSCKEKDTDQ